MTNKPQDEWEKELSKAIFIYLYDGQLESAWESSVENVLSVFRTIAQSEYQRGRREVAQEILKDINDIQTKVSIQDEYFLPKLAELYRKYDQI